METPSYSHLTSKDYNYVYEPSEDTFLLIDALELELPLLEKRKPLVSLEIGSGSGIVISALAKYLPSHSFFAVDINKFACDCTRRTAEANCVNVEVINMDLLSAFKNNTIDLLIFNPPYVPTSTVDDDNVKVLEQNKFYDAEAESSFTKGNDEKMLIKSWAGGGMDGCEVIYRLIPKLNDILASNGIFYLLLIKDNKPEKIIKVLEKYGFKSQQIIERKIRGEHLLVLKIYKNNI